MNKKRDNMTAFSSLGKVSKFLIVGSLLMSFTLLSNPFDNVVKALQKGKVDSLSEYFDNMIEISLSGRSNSYSKRQATIILKNFFSKNEVKKFKIIHKGTSKKGAQFGIGTMVTNRGKYRVTFFFRQKGNQVVLQELRFKRES